MIGWLQIYQIYCYFFFQKKREKTLGGKLLTERGILLHFFLRFCQLNLKFNIYYTVLNEYILLREKNDNNKP